VSFTDRIRAKWFIIAALLTTLLLVGASLGAAQGEIGTPNHLSKKVARPVYPPTPH
jgi:hypothetical protein